MRIMILILLSLLTLPLLAQRNNPMISVTPESFYAGEAVNSIDLRERKTEGSSYWWDDWLPGSIKLSNGTVLRHSGLKYDLLSERLEVYFLSGAKVVPGNQIEEFFLIKEDISHRFVQADVALGLQPQYAGFFEWIYEGEIDLLAKKRIDILAPNYVPALDAGNPNEKMVATETYYLSDGKRLIEIPRKKRKAYEVMEYVTADIGGFLKEEKINPKKVEDLIQAVTEMNRRLEGK